MKIILLIEADPSQYRKMLKLIKNRNPFSFISGKSDEVQEYMVLYNKVEDFTRSGRDIMLVNFSGREDIVQSLGGERPEMIISLSYNKDSKYYVDNPEKMVLDLLEIFSVVKEEELQTI